jgi:Tail specific protease N-terminal domain
MDGAGPHLAFKSISASFFVRLMNKFLRRCVALLPGLVVVALATQPALAKSDSEQIGLSVGRLLEEGHYTHRPLNDEISGKLLTGYLEILDFSHLFFTQKDIDTFTAKYGSMTISCSGT